MNIADQLKIHFHIKLPDSSFIALTQPQAGLTIESPIEDHAAFVFRHIYSHPYPGNRPRHCHGISHVGRAAAYVSVFANLYRKHGDVTAATLTDHDIQLLQIAALFHDAAREDDGVDRWDEESAILLYVYLTQALNVDKAKAVMISEATANKDSREQSTNRTISEALDGQITWENTPPLPKNVYPLPRNIYQKIIHDVDCLDIIRARPAFDATYLDFYRDIARRTPLAFKEMAILITEARGLIVQQGDSYRMLNAELKAKYTNDTAYRLIQEDIQMTVILHQLGQKLLPAETLLRLSLINETPYQPEAGLSDQNLAAAMREGRVFVRGIPTPSAVTKRGETLAYIELRKTFRALGINTRSKKANRDKKYGNSARSISMICFGASIYSRAGFVILNPALDQIESIHSADADTGRGKKKREIPYTHHEAEMQAALDTLHFQQQLGGVSRKCGDFDATHNEVICHLDHYDAIYYTQDANILDHAFNAKQHPYIAFLEAIFLRYEYQKHYQETRQAFLTKWPTEGEQRFLARFGNKEVLPILEYSGSHHFLRQVPEEAISEDKIVTMWTTLAEAMRLESAVIPKLLSYPINQLKIYCTFSCLMPYPGQRQSVEENRSADSNYPPALQDRISAALTEVQARVLREEKENTQRRLLQAGVFKHFVLDIFKKELPVFLRHPILFNEYRTYIESAISLALSSLSDDHIKHINFWAIQDIDAVLSLTDQNATHYTTQPNVVLLFALSKKLGLTEIEKSIQKKAADIIAHQLSELKTNAESLGNSDYQVYRPTYDSTYNLYQQIYFFGLQDVNEAILTSETSTSAHVYSGTFQEHYIELILAHLRNFSSSEFRDAHTVWMFLTQNQNLNKSIVQDRRVQDAAKQLVSTLIVPERLLYTSVDDLYFCLQLCYFLQLDLPLNEMKQYFALHSLVAIYVSSVINILKLLPTPEIQNAVMIEIIQKFQIRSSRIITKWLDEWLEIISAFKSYFSDTIKNAVQSRVDAAVATITFTEWSQNYSDESLVKIMNHLTQFGLRCNAIAQVIYVRIQCEISQDSPEKLIHKIKAWMHFLQNSMPVDLLRKNVLIQLTQIIQRTSRDNPDFSQLILQSRRAAGTGFSMRKLDRRTESLPNSAALFQLAKPVNEENARVAMVDILTH